ncbi:hypothetical protein OROHE_002037 [Orobanche hederae]
MIFILSIFGIYILMEILEILKWRKYKTIRIGVGKGLGKGLLPIGTIGNTAEADRQGPKSV